MHFDPSINIGNILAVVVLLFTVLRTYNAYVQRLSQIEMKLDTIWKWFNDGRNESRSRPHREDSGR